MEHVGSASWAQLPCCVKLQTQEILETRMSFSCTQCPRRWTTKRQTAMATIRHLYAGLSEVHSSQPKSPALTRTKSRMVSHTLLQFYSARLLWCCSSRTLGCDELCKRWRSSRTSTLPRSSPCLMIVPSWLISSPVKYVGIKCTLVAGIVGFAPYSATLYLNNRFDVE